MKKVVALVKVVLEVDDDVAENNSDMLEELNAALNHACGHINSDAIEVTDVDVYHAQPLNYLIGDVLDAFGIETEERVSVASFSMGGSDLEKVIRRHCSMTYRDVEENELVELNEHLYNVDQLHDLLSLPLAKELDAEIRSLTEYCRVYDCSYFRLIEK